MARRSPMKPTDRAEAEKAARREAESPDLPISPSLLFKENLKEVFELVDIHIALTGSGPGRRHQGGILNKSGIVFLCAHFEAFVEDLATKSFDHLITQARDHTGLPSVVVRSVALKLREDKNEIKVWDLAGEGWKSVLSGHKNSLIRQYIGPFNTPKPQNIQEIFHKLIGLRDVTSHWHWKGMTSDQSCEKLKEFVELRGSLSHGTKPARSVKKKDVNEYLEFLARISVKSANAIRGHCHSVTGAYPWDTVRFGSTA